MCLPFLNRSFTKLFVIPGKLLKRLFFILTFFISLQSAAQDNRYIVKFKNKTGTPYSVKEPLKFLSQRSVDRRTRQNIPVDETDLPIVPAYLDSLRSAGKIEVVNQSKWLNQVLIETDDATVLGKINSFPFVEKTTGVNRLSGQPLISRKKLTQNFKETSGIYVVKEGGNTFHYGEAFGQIHIHEGEYLHNKGFRGEGMLIAVLDAGFYHYQSLPAFDSVNINQQVVDTYDFVKSKADVNEEHAHGMHCFSLLASNLPGKLIGTSPKAAFLLYRTEDANTEAPEEEQNWIAAMERADSLGADISTTSLGYNEFDKPTYNYTYTNLDGKTTMMATAATLAARKGMIVLVAAGNEGDKDWKYITTPADADSILSVGAVDISGQVGNFSSYGPTSDGRIAPAVMSLGVSAFVSATDGNIITGNGTSFSAPNLAGLVACLWQAFPEFNHAEIIQTIKESSNNYSNPDNRVGYGIPNFRIAFKNLEKQRSERQMLAILGDRMMKVYPNPFREKITITIQPRHTALATFLLYNNNGKLITTQQVSLTAGKPEEITFSNLQHLQKGTYVLQFIDGKTTESIQVVLQ